MDKVKQNKLIVEFMGLEPHVFQGKYYLAVMPYLSVSGNSRDEVLDKFAESTRYDTDWNWIMVVIDKIESLEDGAYDVAILQDGTQIIKWLSEEIITNYTSAYYDVPTKIQGAYGAVVKFIEWYNKNK